MSSLSKRERRERALAMADARARECERSNYESAAIATDGALGASNFIETIAEPTGYVPGPYLVAELTSTAFAVDGKGATLCICDRKADAERIAYCLNIVEESKKTDRVA